jgi:nucleoside-diphosphate-sugar epimerase
VPCATGFIGRWSVPALVARGFEVHGLGSRKPIPVELKGAVLHNVDLLAAKPVEDLLREVRPTHLLHFAWIADPPAYWTSPLNFSWVSASLKLLREFHLAGGARAVMAGTCAEYDWALGAECDEETSPLATEGPEIALPYVAAKIALQRLLASYGRQEKLSTAWGRIFLQYGPYEDPQRLVSSAICNLLAGKEVLCTHGRQLRNFLHSADTGEAFAALLDGDIEGPVNIGSEERVTVADVVALIAETLGRPHLVRFGARRAPAGEPPILVPIVQRLYQDVGWRPNRNLRQGLIQTIEWWREKWLSSHGQPTLMPSEFGLW